MIAGSKQYQGLNVTFQVTEDCNLRCEYCYELDKRPGTLPFEYAQKFIDLLLTDPDPIDAVGTEMEWILQQGLVMDFIGGDALMLPDLCDKILQYFQYKAYSLNHKWKDRWRSSVSHNGTLLGEPEVRKFLMKYKSNLSLGISVDGCPEIHNKNRNNSMNKILENWDWYLEYMGEFASTKATLNKDSIPWIAKSVKYLHEDLKLSQINMNFIFEEMDLDVNDLIELDKQLAEVVEYILIHRDDMYLNFFDKDFFISDEKESTDDVWCGAGNMPTLSIDGKIYPCFRFAPNTMSDRKLNLSIGDIWSGFTHKENCELVRTQTRLKISDEKCLSCPIESTCAWCIGGAYAEKGEFFRGVGICPTKPLQEKYARLYWNKYHELENDDIIYPEINYGEIDNELFKSFTSQSRY